MSVAKDIFTSKDGESFNYIKIVGAICLAIFFAASFYFYCWKGQPFDLPSWGTVFIALLNTIGGMIRLTHVTEPGSDT